MCWKKAKGETEKCTAVVKELQKDWDRFYSKEIYPSFSVKGRKKKGEVLLETTNMQEKSLQGKLQGVVEDDTKRSAKRWDTAKVCNQAWLMSGNPSPESR